MPPNKESSLGEYSNQELVKMFDYADDHGGYAGGFTHGQIGQELERRTLPPPNPLSTKAHTRVIRLRQRHVDTSAAMREIGRGRSNR